MRLSAFLLFSFIALSISDLSSEIESVTVKWAQGFCSPSCEENLRTRLKSIPQIAEFSVRPGAAEATVRWKPKAKFSYPILNTIIKGAGIHVDQVFIRVRGIIQHDYQNTYLISLGDESRFILLSPITVPASPSQSVSRNNIDSYKLLPQMKEKLVLYEVESRVVTVEGTLFSPWRYMELYLIVQTINTPPFKK